jgi:hypothetical protein
VVAWTFTSPLQRPWFDVLIFVPLVFLPASRLDWVVLGRGIAGGIAYIPGVVVARLHPAWLEADYTTVVRVVAPSGRLLALAALVMLCLTGAWPTGRWRITEMDNWDTEAGDLVRPGVIDTVRRW